VSDGTDLGELDDHRLAAHLATHAGTLLVACRAELWARGASPWQVMDVGDQLAHRYLVGAFAEARPHDAVLSEEGHDDPRRPTAARVWIVDPLDGTNEFGEPGRSDWAVHVALWEQGELVAGAVALPAVEFTYTTDPPAPHPPASGRSRPRLVTSRTRNPYSASIVARALDADAIRLGSAGAKAMTVVRGDADIYVHDGGMYQWDSAAPVAVAAAAGLHTSRIDGSPLIYNRRDAWLPDMLICRPELAADVLAALAHGQRNRFR
jgi:3'(2'), 5'-bisphosphate nucleotidase